MTRSTLIALAGSVLLSITWTGTARGQVASYADTVKFDRPVAYYQFNEAGGSTVADAMDFKTGTVTGNPALGVAGLMTPGMGAENKAIRFGGNGSGDSINLGHDISAAMNGAPAITTELWLKDMPNMEQAQNITTLFTGAKTCANTVMLKGKLRGGGRSCPDDNYKATSSADNPTTGPDGWTYLVVVNDYASRHIYVYINGELASDVAVTGWKNTAYQDAATKAGDRIASTADRNDKTILEAGGLIDEVAFYRYAMPAERVKAHYQAALGQ